MVPIERFCLYEHTFKILITYHLEDMANVKVCIYLCMYVYIYTCACMCAHMCACMAYVEVFADRRTGQKLYAPDFSIREHTSSTKYS
jgi:hypothetical protein